MKALVIGIGAAGNKCVQDAITSGTVDIGNTVMINSTTKDFPAEYDGKKIVLSQRNSGCGKERKVAKTYALEAIKSGSLNIGVEGYTSVLLVTSVEGGTGSGATPVLAKFFNEVVQKNVHVIALCGFQEDVRGLSNTIEFFKEIDSNVIVQAISNSAFLTQAAGNKFRAEQLANAEVAKRIPILTGEVFIPGSQNIDDTDVLKVSNTYGYMTIEQKYLDKPLVDQDDFNRVVKKMINETKSIKSENPGAVRIGVILNISPTSEDDIDYTFQSIKDAYGNPYECFLQKQWDEKKEYIAFIVSGMQMPIEELSKIYDTYLEQTKKVNKQADSFFERMQSMEIEL